MALAPRSGQKDGPNWLGQLPGWTHMWGLYGIRCLVVSDSL